MARLIREKQVPIREEWDDDSMYVQMTGRYGGVEYHVYGHADTPQMYRLLKRALINNINNKRHEMYDGGPLSEGRGRINARASFNRHHRRNLRTGILPDM